MIRYRLVSVDPLNQDDERTLEGTYPLAVVRKLIAACYEDPECRRVPVAIPVEIRPGRRHCYYVEAAGRRWHIVARSPSEAASQAASRGVPARVWYCKDDYSAACPPLIERRKATA